MTMCCEPGHLGPPPEWQADHDNDGGIGLPWPPPDPARVTRETLAAWARLIGPAQAPRVKIHSTYGGTGRALLSVPWAPGTRDDTWQADLWAADPGEGNDWVDWRRGGLS